MKKNLEFRIFWPQEFGLLIIFIFSIVVGHFDTLVIRTIFIFLLSSWIVFPCYLCY